MRSRIFILTATALLALAPMLAGAGPLVEPPADPVTLTLGTETLAVWPFTTDDLATPADPITLVLLNADPRQIRQALFALDGNRGALGFPMAAFNCTWSDAMGFEQAAWAEPEGWVGAEIQLACGPYSSRFHLRLFRQGHLTLAGTHFDVQIPGTAEHEAIAWDFPQAFVVAELQRAGVLTQSPLALPLFDTGGSFKSIRYPVYNGLPAPLRAIMGLAPVPPQTADVPVPNDGIATVLDVDIPFQPIQDRRHQEQTVTYGQMIPRPFCASGPLDFVYVQGDVHFALTTHTNPSGYFSRKYVISGELQVTPFDPITRTPTGPTALAVIWEDHSGLLTDQYGQMEEIISQTLLAQPEQSMTHRFRAGHRDGYTSETVCGGGPQP
jgi:hypothetical protein